MMLPMSAQGREGLRWASFSRERAYRHISEKMVVCGHTAQRSGEPWIDPYIAAIDTFICGDQWLTALDMSDLSAHQANSDGEYRQLAPAIVK